MTTPRDPSHALLPHGFSKPPQVTAAKLKPYSGSIQTRSYGASAAAMPSSSAATAGAAAAAAAAAETAASAANKTLPKTPSSLGIGVGSNVKARVQETLRSPFMVAALPFVNGGLAGMVATAVIQPIDMVKVRHQLNHQKAVAGVPKQGAISIATNIIRNNPLELYTGLSAGLLRQAIYTTARLGFFDTFMKQLSVRAAEQGTTVGFSERAAAGLLAGGLGAALGNPADLALIRMQADGLKPMAERNNYRSVIHALKDVTKNEGILALWNGATPTIVRAMALNFGQLAFFSESKSQLKHLQEKGYHNLNPKVQTLAASAVAGFFASFFSLPFDFLKTRMQQQAKGGQKLNMLGTFLKVAKEEGALRVYRGLPVYYTRIAPHAMVTLLVADYLGFITK